MLKYDEIVKAIEGFAPIDDYIETDSSGTQIRTGSGEIERVLVCLEINDEVIDEAIDKGADMIVTHHPLIFYPISNVSADDVPGRYIIRLLENSISVYSSHLPFDFCATGNNAYLSQLLGLADDQHDFTGTFSKDVTLKEACDITNKALDLPPGYIRVVDGGNEKIRKVGFCTGAGGDMIGDALKAGCDLFITGDLKLHEAQYAKAMGISVIDAGHYGTEKIFVENFAAQLREKAGNKLEVIEAAANTDPYTIIP